MTGIGKPVKPPACFWPAAVLDPDSLGVPAKERPAWWSRLALGSADSPARRGWTRASSQSVLGAAPSAKAWRGVP